MIRIGVMSLRRTSSSIVTQIVSNLYGCAHRAVSLRDHTARSYSVTTTVSKGDDDVNIVRGSRINDASTTSTTSIDDAAASDLKSKYRNVLKYVRTLPSSHNWLRYIKEKVDRWIDGWILMMLMKHIIEYDGLHQLQL